jgi:hypothetical protein
MQQSPYRAAGRHRPFASLRHSVTSSCPPRVHHAQKFADFPRGFVIQFDQLSYAGSFSTCYRGFRAEPSQGLPEPAMGMALIFDSTLFEVRWQRLTRQAQRRREIKAIFFFAPPAPLRGILGQFCNVFFGHSRPKTVSSRTETVRRDPDKSKRYAVPLSYT